MKIKSNSISYSQLRSCLCTYLLGKTLIRYPKTAQKASRDAYASCKRTKSSQINATNSIAACARIYWVNMPIRCLKTAQKVSPRTYAAHRRELGVIRFTPNLIADYAYKKNARGRFDVQKRACRGIERRDIGFANSILTIASTRGAIWAV